MWKQQIRVMSTHCRCFISYKKKMRHRKTTVSVRCWILSAKVTVSDSVDCQVRCINAVAVVRLVPFHYSIGTSHLDFLY